MPDLWPELDLEMCPVTHVIMDTPWINDRELAFIPACSPISYFLPIWVSLLP